MFIAWHVWAALATLAHSVRGPRWARAAWLAAALPVGALAQVGETGEVGGSRGSAVVIGGALQRDNHAVWQKVVDLAGGPGARIAVLATAADNPEKSAADIMQALRQHGAVPEHVAIAPMLKGTDFRAAAMDPKWVARLEACTGVYFAGGAQERITQALLGEGGRPTPVLAAIWSLYRKGGVVAGSSAGAAIMSATMFRDAPDVLAAMQDGLTEGPGRQVDRGLGFIGPDVFVDQHFLKRGRIGRMLPLMVQKAYPIGLGVDENTAAVIRQGVVEVVGQSGVLVVDLTQASHGPPTKGFSVREARLSYLERGDRYQLASRTAVPAPEKAQGQLVSPASQGFEPRYDQDRFFPDILGDRVLVQAMVQLVDGPKDQVLGLAMPAPTSGGSATGFEFRLHRKPDSIGYATSALGGDNYTVLNAYLDVVPVTVAKPLYAPQAAR